MKKFVRSLLCVFSLSALAGAADVVTNTTVKSMMAVWDCTPPGRHNFFSLTGTVHNLLPSDRDQASLPSFILDDGDLLVSIFNRTQSPGDIRPGDRVAVAGIFGLKNCAHGNEPYAVADKIKILEIGTGVLPVKKALKDLSSIRDNLRRIETSGIIIDWRWSEEDPEYISLTVKDGPTTMPVLVPAQDPEAIDRLLESKVSIVGTFNWALPSVRRFARPLIVARFEDIALLASPKALDDIPALERKLYLTPKDILALGKRKIDGEIVAVWQKNNLLLQDRDGRIVRARLSNHNKIAPRTGFRATVCGYPETDQFNIILGTASIVSSAPARSTSQTALRLSSIDGIVGQNRSGSTTFSPAYYGKLVTLRGTVRTLPSPGNAEGRAGLDCDGYLVHLDASACPGAIDSLALGGQIEATGVCLLETNDYDAQADMPHISGLTLILRGTEDLVVLARPPWLTPARFLAILSVMAGLLVLFLVWNASLRVLVDRRGHELARKQVEATKARFKTIERTRLATELHDSVVQNLTGAALEIRAVQAALPEMDKALSPHLDLALKTINSSRAELRNCIWDLRNQALEKNNIDEAVAITLQPHLGDARLLVRFAVPRRKIPDNEFHGILCVIRELAVNAVRHGRASTIKVAGALDKKRLRFSVADDGCGFDLATRPSMEQGHFGLEGIFERVKNLNGKVDIASAPGKGSRITIDIPLPKENE